MSENRLDQSTIQDEAFRIASALVQFAAFLNDEALSPALKHHAVRLVDLGSAPAAHEVGITTRTIEHLVQLGHDMGIVQEADASVMRRALRTYATHVNDQPRKLSLAAFGLENLLPHESGNPAKQTNENPAIRQISQPIRQSNPAIRQSTKTEDIQQKHRRDKILAAIRQSGKARLKEIQDALPDTSERTVRYDLGKLVEEGRIERVGSGGVGSYYRVPQAGAVMAQESVQARV